MFALPDKTPTEAKVVTFDFSGEAASGSTLAGQTIAKSVLSGSDPGAAALSLGSPSVAGQTVLVMVSGGLDGVRYELYCSVTASNGEEHERAAALRVAAGAV